MSIELIDRLLADHDHAFECTAIRGVPDSERHVERLVHLANPPADPALLKRIPKVQGTKVAEALYRAYDGLLLYTDRATETAGVEIFPIEWWDERTAQIVASWTEEEELYPEDDMPYGRNDFIAFAHCRGASNYLHWVVRGPRAGSVYWWAWTMRPKRSTPPMADNFAAFLELICERPVHFFNDLLLSYIRFENERPLVEWLPSRYLPDRQQPSVGR